MGFFTGSKGKIKWKSPYGSLPKDYANTLARLYRENYEKYIGDFYNNIFKSLGYQNQVGGLLSQLSNELYNAAQGNIPEKVKEISSSASRYARTNLNDLLSRTMARSIRPALMSASYNGYMSPSALGTALGKIAETYGRGISDVLVNGIGNPALAPTSYLSSQLENLGKAGGLLSATLSPVYQTSYAGIDSLNTPMYGLMNMLNNSWMAKVKKPSAGLLGSLEGMAQAYMPFTFMKFSNALLNPLMSNLGNLIGGNNYVSNRSF